MVRRQLLLPENVTQALTCIVEMSVGNLDPDTE